MTPRWWVGLKQPVAVHKRAPQHIGAVFASGPIGESATLLACSGGFPWILRRNRMTNQNKTSDK